MFSLIMLITTVVTVTVFVVVLYFSIYNMSRRRVLINQGQSRLRNKIRVIFVKEIRNVNTDVSFMSTQTLKE